MKASHRILLALTLVAAAAVTIHQVKSTLDTAAANSTGAPAVEIPGAADAASSPETSGATARHPLPRPQRPENTIPNGIDSDTWKQSAAIVTLMSSMPDQILANGPVFMSKEQSAKVRAVAGMNDAAFDAFMTQIESRNEKTKAATKETLDRLLENPQKMTELISLASLKQKGKLSPVQEERLNALEPDFKFLEGGLEHDLKPWHEDTGFVSEVRASLDAEGTEGFDAYVEEQRAAAAAQKVEALSKGVDLDEAQKAALQQMFRDHPEGTEAGMQSILTEKQRAELDAGDISVGIQMEAR